MTGQAKLDNKLPLFLLALAAASFLVPTPANSQSSTADDEVEEIIVTGSRIKRRDFTSPSPIATIDQDSITTSGQFTLEETLNRMPQVVPDLSKTANNGSDGTARVNLRGFGAGRTLVLLNGRRIAPSGVGSAVDINNIPQALIDRVEIITGGASTVYGSDAIAGVVNFITKDNFEGLGIDVGGQTTFEGDAQSYDLTLTYGHNYDNGNVTVYGGGFNRDYLFASDRELTRISLANDSDTGELVVSGSPVTPSGIIFFPRFDFGNDPSRVTYDANGVFREFQDPEDRYNFAEVNYLQTPLTRFTAGIMGHHEFSNGFEMYYEGSFTRNDSAQELAPVPAADLMIVNTDNPVLAPETAQFFNDNYLIGPNLAGFFGGIRLAEVGGRQIEQQRDYYRAVLGVRGDLGSTWDIDAWVTYTDSTETQLQKNDGSASRFLQGLLVDPATGQCFDPSDGCVPLDVFGPGRLSVEGQNFIRVPDLQNDTERVQKLAAVVVTGAPFDTWAGPLDLAFGIDWRSDQAKFKADDILFTDDTLGYRGDAPVDGTESVVELYGEALVPLVSGKAWAESLALELGLRYSEYDLAGGVWTYKVGGDWQITESFRLRGMHQKSVRAPNNQELFQEQYTESSVFVGQDTSMDPCSASNDPVALGYTEKCVIQGMPASEVGVFEASTVPADFVQGGNPELIPETAKTWTLGTVIAPSGAPNWNFAIDYFQMEVTDSNWWH